MSSYLCAITQQQIEDPVVSKLTGHIFERRIIEKQIDATGQCPFTHQNMSKNDLVSLQVEKSQRSQYYSQNNIPQLLTIFQSEWDALLLEQSTLKQQLETVRQELSHALYQHDAAVRVITRVCRERDQLKDAIQRLQDERGQMEVEKQTSSLPADIVNAVVEKAYELNHQRKEIKKLKEQAFVDYCSLDQIKSYNQKIHVPLHSASSPGILSLDIHKQNQNIFVTGGVDGNAILFDSQQQRIISTFEHHSKKINQVQFVSNGDNIGVVTCSDDNTACFFNHNSASKQITVEYEAKVHTQAVTALDMHPLRYLLALASKDQSFSFHDLSTAKLLTRIPQIDENCSWRQNISYIIKIYLQNLSQ